METCYVCLETMDIEKLAPYVCHKNIDGDIRYRHLWHGVPGITRTAPSAGVAGYAKTLEDAKRRAEYYINSNPYAAPEVRDGELSVLQAVELEEKNA